MTATASVPPRANADLRGQGAAEAALLAAWESRRIPHAWLLAGPRGIGKATLAYRFARFVLAQATGEGAALFGAPPPATSLAIAATNPVFRRIAAGGHADLAVLEPGMIHPDTGKETRDIVVPHVRRAIDFLMMTPAEGGWRVVIVDHAEEMNTSAANALLKILEEPHARTLLMLVSHASGRLLPTIRSRCRRLDMPPLEPDVVAALLAEQARELPAADRQAVALLAGGSIGRALELVEADGLDLYRAVLAAVSARDAGGDVLHAMAERVGGIGTAAQAEFRLFLELCQHLAGLCARAAAGVPQTAALSEESDAVARLAQRSATTWLAVWDRIRRLSSASDGLNLDRRQTALAALFAFREAAA
ncbi:MAG: DNA polymerase III subunit delta' [Alphaproteobacteria bacterium]|nr:DNA polymerase III subunit delta' [Alphaproteobacteria bacterium]